MDKLSSYFDNELNEIEIKEFEKKLEKNLDSQKELRELQKLEKILLQGKNYVNVPEELDNNIFRLMQILNPSPSHKSLLYYTQVASIIFAFLFGLFLGNFFFENNLNSSKYYTLNNSILNSNIYSYFYGDSNEK